MGGPTFSDPNLEITDSVEGPYTVQGLPPLSTGSRQDPKGFVQINGDNNSSNEDIIKRPSKHAKKPSTAAVVTRNNNSRNEYHALTEPGIVGVQVKNLKAAKSQRAGPSADLQSRFGKAPPVDPNLR